MQAAIAWKAMPLRMHCELDAVDYFAAGGGFRIERFALETVVPSRLVAAPLTLLFSKPADKSFTTCRLAHRVHHALFFALSSPELSTTLELLQLAYAVDLTAVPCSSAETSRPLYRG
ncbi:hypothetical protein OPT61_g7457 [Boeremia exigua]|uniref:Uncharacterized protein n=1 Tax=Boeremia exigua TaxID=749465 RepID=A0ACC2I2C4_9PLEO|nr:hypothetical protein OPT61_g7457 [Boeremia exigua]